MGNANDFRQVLPPWLRVKAGKAQCGTDTRRILASCGVHTVCQEARCPNVGDCFGRHTATFLILGDTCTRNCRFCAVKHGRPSPPDPKEPSRVAKAAAELGLRFVVVTSVTRDDLPDGGAAQFAATIQALHEWLGRVGVEVLVPDFGGNEDALTEVALAKPTVLNHNVETVRRLQAMVRPQADYERSLWVLRRAKELEPALVTKSGLMVGLGETDEEIYDALQDLRRVGCDIVTIGQYLRPTRRHLPVARYVEPERFEMYEKWAGEMGFKYVASGPFVRSSYRAAEGAKKALED
jgi:lipoic acid synthetase